MKYIYGNKCYWIRVKKDSPFIIAICKPPYLFTFDLQYLKPEEVYFIDTDPIIRAAKISADPITFDLEAIERKIFDYVSLYCGVSVSDILGRRRLSKIAEARQICMFLFRKYLKYSFPKIGEVLSRDHATIIYGVKCVEETITESALNSHERFMRQFKLPMA